MSDEINAIETSIVAALKADSYLGNTANVKIIETKIRPDLSSFTKEELPGIGVIISTIADEGPDDSTANMSFDLNIPCVIEVVDGGADVKAIDSKVKRRISEIRRYFREAKDGTHGDLGTLIGTGVIDINNGATIFEWREPDDALAQWVVTGNTVLNIQMEVQNV